MSIDDHPPSRVKADRSLVRRRAPWLLGTGVALAAAAMYVQYRSKLAEQENPPAGKFIAVDGVRLHYLERGQGKPVVLLHGNGTMAKDFDVSGLLDLASDKYRVIVFDRPGYGYSERPRTTIWGPGAQAQLLYQALQRLGVEQPVVVGHSWGAMVAVALGLAYPEYVRSLVLLSGYYYPTPRLDVPLLSPAALPLIGDLMRYTISPLIGRLIWPAMVRKIFAPAKPTARFKNEFPVWMTLRPVQLRASAAETGLMIPSAYKLSARYPELRMPVVIMSGASDLHIASKLHSERLHKELPQSELILLPGAGHMIQHLVPQQVMSAIDKAAQPIPPKSIVQSPAPTEAV
ncbi:MAG: alpha/beta hydrolase [Herbaspirillum sp.]|nr:alpha/beta hydrolase [Herbaspirillum sp.]